MFRKIVWVIVIFGLLWSYPINPSGADYLVNAQAGGAALVNKRTFIPMVAAAGTPAPTPVVLLGTYTDGYLGQQATIDTEVKGLESWSGKKVSIVGTFIAIEDQYPDYNIPVPLGLIWDAGYTPFVNLETAKKLADINNYSMDGQIRKMAQAFKKWRDDGLAKNQNRKALVAPLQEMDGYWTSYHGTPADFKAAFNRIQYLFSIENASSAVRWVFAPNGWTDPSDRPFEEYYPGDGAVEFIAFSGFNAGYCASASWKSWDTAEKVYAPYIQRIRALAPSKKIFVGQTGTSAYDQTGYNEQAKNTWLKNSYAYLATTGIAGVIYFNKAKYQNCDWAFYQPSGQKFDGYRLGVNRSEFVYKVSGSW
jgi:hypothetical protein